jgi:hypothetical protein
MAATSWVWSALDVMPRHERADAREQCAAAVQLALPFRVNASGVVTLAPPHVVTA